MFKVIKSFIDLKDGNHKYEVGDVFPYERRSISDERIAELSGPHNKMGEPLIKEIKEEKAEKVEKPEKPKKKKAKGE